MIKSAAAVLISSLIFFVFPIQVFASHAQTNAIYFLGTEKTIILPSQNEAGGFSLALGDLGDDGVAELVVGNGLGSEPRVRILRQDGSEIGSFLAYDATMKVGVNVVVCDLDGDGLNEIVTTLQYGGEPEIRLFDRFGKPIGKSVLAYAKEFKGGVNLACGNLIGDERAELVTFPSATGGPHVRIWNQEDNALKLTKEFFAFDATDRSGVVGVVSEHQLIVSQQKTNQPVIKTFLLEPQMKLVDEESIVINASGITSIVIHNQERLLSTSSNGLMYDLENRTEKNVSSSTNSFVLASDDLDGDGVEELIAADARPIFHSTDETKIVVDLSEQRLFAYKRGVLANSFLISSGKNNATPVGKHQILAKIPKVHYKWTYGQNDPRNYDLGLVPYNLRFAPHIYLHYAYWHNNFGHPMSRGCVNVGLENMKWLYNWAEEKIPVDVVE